jgi:hypothetical protein
LIVTNILQGGIKSEEWASETAELEAIDAQKRFDRLPHNKHSNVRKHIMLDEDSDDDDDDSNSTLDGGDNATSSNSTDSNATVAAEPEEEEVKDDQEGYAHYQDACDTTKDPLDLTMNCWLRSVI